MNIERVFNAVKEESDQPTIIVATIELEQQGYDVLIAGKYHGSQELIEADEDGDLSLLPMNNGVLFEVTIGNEKQRFRLHFLDIDQICFTSEDSLPLEYNEEFTVTHFNEGRNN
ncbi:MAG: hypothetical protein KGJ59_06405 [Bacteroidota bacterium]|nr:hypothetical protein [Bacteroidota bacterium]